MIKAKKTAALLLALSIIAGVSAGCTSATSGSASTAESQSATQTASSTASGATEAAPVDSGYQRNAEGYPDLKGQTFKIWFSLQGYQTKFTNDLGDYVPIQKLEGLVNANFEFIHPPLGQEKDNFSIMMAGGDWPDMIFCSGISSHYPGGIQTALADGVMTDPTPYISEAGTPNFWEKIMADPETRSWFTDDEGRIVKFGSKVSGSKEADIAYYGPMMRKDYLEATGLDVPVTIDDWYHVLTAMKANGVEYPFATNSAGWRIQRDSAAFLSAYGIKFEYYIKEDGKTIGYGAYEPAFKDYLTTMNKWYQEGLINPDFATQSLDDVSAMMAADKIGAAVTHLATYGAMYYDTNESANPDAAMIPIPYPVLNQGDPLTRFRPGSYGGVGDDKGITTSAKDPEACALLLDILYKDEVDTFLQFGTEGVTYEIIDGVPVSTVLPEGAPAGQQLQGCPGQWHTTEDSRMAGVLVKYGKGSQPAAIALWREASTEGNVPGNIILTPDESAVEAKYKADVTTYIDEMELKFITGVESLDGFDAYIERLKSLHIEDLIAIRQAAYDRYQSR